MQIDDDFLAHYQLSYGFNSSDNATISANNTCTNLSSTKTNEINSIENQLESNNVSIEKTESEKRKLSQPSEPSK